jgi:hypothetical protein
MSRAHAEVARSTRSVAGNRPIRFHGLLSLSEGAGVYSDKTSQKSANLLNVLGLWSSDEKNRPGHAKHCSAVDKRRGSTVY